MTKWFEIKALNNSAEISIYDEIGGWGVTAKEFMDELKAVGDVSSITLRINSPGGSVFDGMAIFNRIKQHPAEVTAYIDGLAASMASVIAMAADKVVMPENAMMMIHNPWTFAHGDAEELRDSAELLDKIKTTMLSAYSNKSGLSNDEIAAIMDEETWLTGQEAVEMGFADVSEDAVDIAASVKNFDLTKFQNSPKDFHKPSAVAGVNPKEGVMPEKTPVTDVTNQAAIDDAVNAALAKEETRKSEIVSAFGEFANDHGELLNKCLLDQKVTSSDAQAKLLAAMGAKEKPVGGGRIETVDEQAKGRIDAMSDVIVARTGVGKADLQGNQYRGSTLLEMAGHCLASRNVSTAGMDKMGIVAAAFTHSSGDFGNLLSNSAGKAMLKGYDEVEESFEKFCSVGELPDFKETTRVDLNAAPSLREVKEGAEYKTVTIGDRGETVQLATFGELFSITRQAIINDDLSAFTRIPQRLGRAARRTVGDLVFAILTGNPNMSDGKALFHADHANALTSAALGVSAFSDARSAMGTQKDASGNANLNISPSFLLVPKSLESTALQLMGSEADPSKTNSKAINPVRNAAEVIADSRLDAVSASTWYALAGMMHDVIEVQYLDGNSAPMLEQQAGWGVDGVDFKVRLDAGAKALDHRTMVRGVA